CCTKNTACAGPGDPARPGHEAPMTAFSVPAGGYGRSAGSCQPAERLAALNLGPVPVKIFPLFSEAAIGGACPKCHGTQFQVPREEAGTAFPKGQSAKYVECLTCGLLFRKG